MGGVLQLLCDWCDEEHVPWRPVARRIRIVGLTYREKTSPKTKRWQQHADWVHVLRPASIKNVSIRPELCWWLATDTPKATEWFPPWRWADPEVMAPRHDEEARRGLEFARHLFELGCATTTRNRFARVLLQQPVAKESWLRSLALEIRR